jgi:hypothetical protein
MDKFSHKKKKTMDKFKTTKRKSEVEHGSIFSPTKLNPWSSKHNPQKMALKYGYLQTTIHVRIGVSTLRYLFELFQVYL